MIVFAYLYMSACSCSECIRSNLEYKRKQTQQPACPECRKPVESNQLTPNFALRETVTAFHRALPQLQEFIRSQVTATKQLQEQLQQQQLQRVSGSDITNNRVLNKTEMASVQKSKKRATDIRSGINKLVSRKPAEVCVLDDEEDNVGMTHHHHHLQQQHVASAGTTPEPDTTDRAHDHQAENDQDNADHAHRQRTHDGSAQQSHAPAPGSVLCPLCCMSVRESLINTHLDNCLSRSGAAQGNKQQQTHQATTASRNAHRSSGGGGFIGPVTNSTSSKRPADGLAPSAQVQPSVKKRKANSVSTSDLPPTLVFNVMKDKDLRTKLKQLGLPTDGSKEVRRLYVCVIMYIYSDAMQICATHLNYARHLCRLYGNVVLC